LQVINERSMGSLGSAINSMLWFKQGVNVRADVDHYSFTSSMNSGIKALKTLISTNTPKSNTLITLVKSMSRSGAVHPFLINFYKFISTSLVSWI
jgi:hypothetical protein